MAHGPALCQAYGRYLGAFLMLVAITKARRGTIGILAVVGILGSFIYRMYLK